MPVAMVVAEAAVFAVGVVLDADVCLAVVAAVLAVELWKAALPQGMQSQQNLFQQRWMVWM